MPKPQTVYQLVCCGPSDTSKEVDLVKQVVAEWNLSIGLEADYFVRFTHWATDSTPDLSDPPQGVINRQIIDKADMLVAIFWNRFGTPTAKAKSGTEEEIRRAIKKKTRVLLYFSDVFRAGPAGDEHQFQMVQEFRHEMSTKGLSSKFQSREEFQRLFKMHLGRVVQEMQSKTKSCAPSPKKKSASSVNQRGHVNVNAAGDGDHRSVVINVHAPHPKPAPKSKYAANSIGADADLVTYIDYLFGLAVEYWEGVEAMSPGRLGMKIKTKFRLKLRTRNHLSVRRFDELVGFIIEELLKPSPAGKKHIEESTKLCRSFEEFRSGPM